MTHYSFQCHYGKQKFDRWGGGKDGGVELRVSCTATGGHIDVSGLCRIPSEVMAMSRFMLPTRAMSVLVCVARVTIKADECL